MSALLAHALAYAAAGYPVLPLHTPWPTGRCSCARPACTRPGKHPRWHRRLIPRGLHDASTDPQQIRTWWAHWPAANVGLATGIRHDVCDIDSVTGLNTLLDLLGDDAFTGPTVLTGSGGWHLYLAATGLGNRVGVLPGVDWRGTGGYVVAPPSLHACGRRYRWTRDLDTAELPPCPPPLHRLLDAPPAPTQTTLSAAHKPGRYAEAALAHELDRVRAATQPRLVNGVPQPGNRNDTLNRSAFALGQLVGAGLLDHHTVERELTAAARSVGLGIVEAARTIHSGLSAGIRQPRFRQPATASPIPASTSTRRNPR